MANAWSIPTLLLGVIGALALLALGVVAAELMIPAGLAAVALLAAGVYFAAPRSPASEQPLTTQETVLPSAPSIAAAPLLDAMRDPIIVLDGSGKVLFANSASRPLVGADSLRKHISAVLRYPEILEGADRVLKGGDAESILFSVKVPVARHYRAQIARCSDEEGALLILHFSDLTSVRRSEELRADFVANASHELRTPLSSVSGFIDTLRGHAKNDAEARERFLEIMSVETARMRRLIDDLLSLSRIELNEHNPPMDRVDLVGVVGEAAAALSPLAQADKVTLEIGKSEPLWVTGDRDELTQVFQNLIHNAIKYGGDAGTVHVEFGTTPGAGRNAPAQVFASVRDAGEGIPREAIPRLTERFYRIDVKRSRERGGTGLGLAIVKHILNRHNGKLHIDSVVGEGSTFTVTLPAESVPSGQDETLANPEIRRAS